MMKAENVEVWRKIILEELVPNANFWISNLGNIKSYNQNKVDGKLIKGSKLHGYRVLFVKLMSGKTKLLFIHKLVAENFVMTRKEGQEVVIHLDYNIENNHFRNLRWANKEEVIKHKLANKSKKNSTYISKLNSDNIRDIRTKARRLKKQGKAIYATLAREFGVSETQIKRIVLRKCWKSI